VQIEVHFPNEFERQQILAVLLRPMIEGSVIKLDNAYKWTFDLALMTDGFTGADLAGNVKVCIQRVLIRSKTMCLFYFIFISRSS
jgi:ATP-dependent 26S proteasome regulatory subunit